MRGQVSIFALSVLAGIAASTASARTITVETDGSGEFTSIQEAILESSSGDIVEVGPGVYYEALTFWGRRIVLRSTDGPEKTIIDGSNETDSIIQLWLNEPRTLRIVGFTLRAGRGTPIEEPLSSEGGRLGGAVLCNPGSATFENIWFEGNTANTGGAVYSGSSGSPLFLDCVFRDNFAGLGGAVATRFARPVFDHCRFLANESVKGGAMYDHEGAIVCRDSVFDGNFATTGGAVYVQFGVGQGRFERVYFTNNQAPEGAAVYVTDSIVDLDACVVAENAFPFEGYFPAQVHYRAADGMLSHNVFFSSPERSDVPPTFCEQGPGPDTTCNLYWPSLPSDGCGVASNSALANPRFCAPGRGDFGLRPDSPCLPENDPSGCGGFGPETEPSCPLPAVDIRSLGGSLDVQTLQDKMIDRPPAGAP